MTKEGRHMPNQYSRSSKIGAHPKDSQLDGFVSTAPDLKQRDVVDCGNGKGDQEEEHKASS